MNAAAIFSQFGLAWSAYVLATASPGPGVMAIIGTSAEAGRRAGVCLALGILSGSITWALLTLAGISTLIQSHPQVLSLVRLAGGSYLLWLGWGAATRAVAGNASSRAKAAGESRLIGHYLRGYGVHITNPKAVMAWIMLASLALPPHPTPGLALTFVAGCLLIGTTVFLGYALIFSIPAVLAAYNRMSRPINSIMALLFGYAGLALLIGVLLPAR